MRDVYGLDDSDYEIIDGVRILRDGRKMVVPLFLRDASHRDASRAALEAAYALREYEDCNAWRADFQDAMRRKRGGYHDRSAGLVQAYQEEKEERLDALGYTVDQLNPHSKNFSLDAALKAREQAYLNHDREQENAWRKPG
jgi:hypothetical protein